MTLLWQYAQLGGILAALACLGRVAFRGFSWPIQLAFGQFLMLVYAYLRTASVRLGTPGLSSWELWIPLVAAVVWTLRTGLRVRRGGVLLAAFAVLCALLALRFPDLGTLSSDPDLHAFQTKWFLESGHFTGFYPQSEVVDRYPGGFRVLNLLWGRLSGWNAVTLVNVQPYLQAVIMAVAAVFLFSRAVPARKVSGYFALAIFCALLVYLPAWGDGRQNNEGTARLAANGFLILPLLAAWLGRRRRAPALFALSGMTLPMAVSFNPALILPLLVLTTTAGALLNPRRESRIAFALGAVGFGVVVALTDPFLLGLGTVGVNQDGNPTQPLAAIGIIDWLWLPAAIVVGALGACALAGHGLSWLSGVAAAGAVRPLSKSPGRAIWFSLWAIFLLGTETAIQILLRTIPRASLGPYLFFRYTEATAEQLALVFAGVLMPFLMLSVWRLRAGRWIFAILMVGLLLRVEENWRLGLRSMTRSTLGKITPDAVALVQAAGEKVGAGERVLLVGRLMDGPWESWVMPENASRAVALYSNLTTAFYYGVDHPDFRAENYRRYVQEKLDVAWLRERGVKWAIVQGEDPRFSEMGIEVQRGDVKLVRIE